MRHPTGLAGVVLLGIVLVAAVFGSWLAPYDPQLFHPMARLQGPTPAHWLGTDQFGRDILSRILTGARTTIAFGVSATLLGVAFGAVIGVTAGVIGGWVDSLIMRLVDGLLAVPDLLFTLLIVTVLGGGAGPRAPSRRGRLHARHGAHLAQRRTVHPHARIRPGGRGARRVALLHHRVGGPAELAGTAHRRGDHPGILRDHARRDTGLPRPRRAAAQH